MKSHKYTQYSYYFHLNTARFLSAFTDFALSSHYMYKEYPNFDFVIYKSC